MADFRLYLDRYDQGQLRLLITKRPCSALVQIVTESFIVSSQGRIKLSVEHFVYKPSPQAMSLQPERIIGRLQLNHASCLFQYCCLLQNEPSLSGGI